MKQERKRYSEQFKQDVVADILRTGISKDEARRIYGIRGKGLLADWLNRYGKEVNERLSLQPMEPSDYEKKIKELERRLAEAENEAAMARHKAGLYETMMDIAKEKFNIDIRKKFDTRQWRATKQNTPKP